MFRGPSGGTRSWTRRACSRVSRSRPSHRFQTSFRRGNMGPIVAVEDGGAEIGKRSKAGSIRHMRTRSRSLSQHRQLADIASYYQRSTVTGDGRWSQLCLLRP